MTDKEIREIFRSLTRNKSGFGNYRELLMHTFGKQEGERLFGLERAQLEMEVERGVAGGYTSRSGSSGVMIKEKSFRVPR